MKMGMAKLWITSVHSNKRNNMEKGLKLNENFLSEGGLEGKRDHLARWEQCH